MSGIVCDDRKAALYGACESDSTACKADAMPKQDGWLFDLYRRVLKIIHGPKQL